MFFFVFSFFTGSLKSESHLFNLHHVAIQDGVVG